MAIWFFSEARNSFTEITERQIPEIALANQLTEVATRLAGIATRIAMPEAASDKSRLRDDLSSTAADLFRLAGLSADLHGTGTESLISITRIIENKLQRTLNNATEKKLLDSRLDTYRIELRWLNADIQEEVSALLRDLSYNIDSAAYKLLDKSDRQSRERASKQIQQDRELRFIIQRIGADSATLITLLLQADSATNLEQIDPLQQLAADLLLNLSQQLSSLQQTTELLTLRQSLGSLEQLSSGKNSLFKKYQNAIAIRSTLLGNLIFAQESLGNLQSELAVLGKSRRSEALMVAGRTSRQLDRSRNWLSLIVIAGTILGALILVLYIRNCIVLRLENLSTDLMRIAEADDNGQANSTLVPTDEFGRMDHALNVFRKSVLTRDQALMHLRTEVGERKLAVENLERAQAELVKTGKLAALGQLSAGISHELNQPLAAIKHRIHSARLTLDNASLEERHSRLDAIENLVNRMSQTIIHLKQFARRTDHPLEQVLLTRVFNYGLELLDNKLKSNKIKINGVADLQSETAIGDPILLEQIVVNLFSNAIDAIGRDRDDGLIILSFVHHDFMIDITVSDNGIGLEECDSNLIFDPFYSTKEVGEALGLGLSISYNIVKDFGGNLRLEPNPFGGTNAILSLRRSLDA